MSTSRSCTGLTNAFYLACYKQQATRPHPLLRLCNNPPQQWPGRQSAASNRAPQQAHPNVCKRVKCLRPSHIVHKNDALGAAVVCCKPWQLVCRGNTSVKRQRGDARSAHGVSKVLQAEWPLRGQGSSKAGGSKCPQQPSPGASQLVSVRKRSCPAVSHIVSFCMRQGRRRAQGTWGQLGGVQCCCPGGAARAWLARHSGMRLCSASAPPLPNSSPHSPPSCRPAAPLLP